MNTRRHRSFVPLLIFLGVGACEREAPKENVICGNDCESNDATCNAEGLLVQCEVGEDQCRSWSEPTPCSSRQLCTEGECRCTNPCEEGMTRCEGDDEVRCIQPAKDGCFDWGEPTPCPGGQICEGGACDCEARCQLGQAICEGGKLRNCAGPDAEGCNYWDDPVDCPDHQICSAGECLCANPCLVVGQTECSPEADGVWTCQREPDGDQCFYWDEAPCQEGDVCIEEITECRLDTPPECDDVNECAYEGQKLCMNETQYRACHYTEEGCLVWDCGT